MPQSVATTRRLHQAYAANRLEDGFWRADWLETIRTESPRMREVYEKVKSVAPTKTTVLLQGDTGVGKGNIAKLIHQHSSRKDGPFVHVHCGTLPDTLVESELFGYEKGAFTGAEKRKLGRFDSAQKGTIFLDEIGDMTQPEPVDQVANRAAKLKAERDSQYPRRVDNRPVYPRQHRHRAQRQLPWKHSPVLRNRPAQGDDDDQAEQALEVQKAEHETAIPARPAPASSASRTK